LLNIEDGGSLPAIDVGRGDLLLAAGTSTLVRLQSAYLSDVDRQEIFRHK
jgi:hypothetical protein